MAGASVAEASVAPLTEASLKQLEEAPAVAPALPPAAPAAPWVADEFEDHGLRKLQEEEASAARLQNIEALHREFATLKELGAAEAGGWQQRRERNAVCLIQSAWRRRTTRALFLRTVHVLKQQRRGAAAAAIQRAQRTRRRVVAEAAPPISKEQLATLQAEVVERTLALAKELREARAAQAAWYAHPTEGQKAPPPLPEWYDEPKWERDITSSKAAGGLYGGPALVSELRETAMRGLTSPAPMAEMTRAARDWPKQRAAIQAAAVRRQVSRTQAASLHAQLTHPPPLPSAAVIARSMGGDDLDSTFTAPVKPHVLVAHRAALKQAKYTIESEEKAKVAADAVANGEPMRPGQASAHGQGLKRFVERFGKLPIAESAEDQITPAERLWLDEIMAEDIPAQNPKVPDPPTF